MIKEKASGMKRGAKKNRPPAELPYEIQDTVIKGGTTSAPTQIFPRKCRHSMKESTNRGRKES